MIVALMAMVGEEDQPRFEELYYKYVKLMYYIARQYLDIHEDVEDAVYISFSKIAKVFHRINDITCPQTKALIVIITRNTAKDIVKKNNRDLRLERLEDIDADSLSYHPIGFDGPFESFSRNELIEAVRSLPENYSDVLYLYSVYGYKTNEIATMLGLKQEVVKKRLQRARKKLAEYLGLNDENS